jgi:hypothetical protein
MPAPLLLVSTAVEAPARDRLWVLRVFDIDERASSPECTATVGGFEPADGLGAPPHAGVARCGDAG